MVESSQLNLHAMRMGPGKHLKGLTLWNGLVKPEEVCFSLLTHDFAALSSPLTSSSLITFTRLGSLLVSLVQLIDYTQLIIMQELTRHGARGYGDALLGGKVIGLPPVINFGSDELKAKVVPEVLSGKKFICLAISEAQAGSDVFGLQTTAVKTEDGKEGIINVSKKWITNGTVSSYFGLIAMLADGIEVLGLVRSACKVVIAYLTY